LKKLIPFILFFIYINLNISAQSATQLFQEGRDAFSDKLFSRSIESFKEFIDKYPADPRDDQADYMIGVSLFYLKKFDQVIQHFNRYAQQYPGSAYLRRIHYWKGLSHYGQGDFRSAINELQKQADISEELYFRQKSLQLLGYSYEKTEQYELAGLSYKKLYESNPDKNLSALALEKQGYIQFKLGNYKAALDFFDKVTVQFSSVPQIMKEIPFYQAECYYQLKDYEKSLNRYETFLSLYSNSVNREKAVFRLGSLYAQLNQQDAAMEYMNLLTKEFPNSKYLKDAHRILAESYLANRDMPAARSSLSKLLEEEKDPVEIQKLQFNMAQSWEKKPEEALKWYIKASKGLDPDIAGESLYRSGVIYDTMKDPGRAVLLFEKLFNQYKNNSHREEVGDWIVNYYETAKQDIALKNHLDRMLTEFPESGKRTLYLYMRGNISYREGNQNEALRYYQNILNVETKDKLLLNETRYRIGYIYTLRKEFSRAAEYFNRVLETQSEGELYYRSLLSLGICSLNMKENDQAKERFLKLVNNAKNPNPWTGDAYYYLGKIMMDEGSYEEASDYFKLSVKTSGAKERKIQAYYQLGWSFMRLTKFQDASKAFDAIWDLDSTNPLSGDSLYRSGTALSYLELWDEALIRYKKALEQVEFFNLREELLYQTAWAYFMLKKFDPALEYLKKLEVEFPNSPLPADGLFRAAEALHESGDIHSSVNAYKTLYKEFSTSPLAETALYRALSQTEDVDDKLLLMKDFFNKYSGNERAFQTALQLEGLLERKKIDEKKIDNILQLNLTENERAVIVLGTLYNKLNQEETFGKLDSIANMNIRPADQEKVKLYKALWYYYKKNYPKAEELFSDILKGDISEYSAEAQFFSAKILDNQGEWKKAADKYLSIRYRYPDQKTWVIKSIYQAAISYKKAGDTESFQRTSKMLSEDYPDSPYIDELKADSSAPVSNDSTDKGETGTGNDLESLSPSSEILPLIDNQKN